MRIISFLLFLCILTGCSWQSSSSFKYPLASKNIYQKKLSGKKEIIQKISGPYTEDNLSIFFIHGPERFREKKIITLGEGMQSQKIIVEETETVSELRIQNNSQDALLYIQAGEIVRGGKQDRVISTDLVIAPNQEPVIVSCFCVESDRWQKRGEESADAFHSSENIAATNDLMVALKHEQNQSQVWNKVSQAQKKLSQKLGASVQSEESSSSMELSLENKVLEKTITRYIKSMEKAKVQQKEILGYALAINGQMKRADIYGSYALFDKLWPKLLKAASVEAIAEQKESADYPALSVNDVEKWLEQRKEAQVKEKSLDEKNKARSFENNRFLSQETSFEDDIIHDSFLEKSEDYEEMNEMDEYGQGYCEPPYDEYEEYEENLEEDFDGEME